MSNNAECPLRYRLSRAARRDIEAILRRSESQHGADARRRYAALLVAAFRRVASAPTGPGTSERPELAAGVRAFHLRHIRRHSDEARVANPVHMVFYRVTDRGAVEIVRVLHERMDPTRHIRWSG